MSVGDPWRFGRARRFVVALGVTLAVALLAAACGGSGSRYVANTDEGAFFKLPKDWNVIEVPAARVAERPELAGFADIVESNVWVRIALPVESSGTPGADLPLIRVVTGDLKREIRDRISLQSLRSFIVNGEFDPLNADALKENSSRLLGYQEVAGAGVRGFHTRVQVGLDQPETSSVIDQHVLVDDDTTTLIFFDIRCNTKCFTDNVSTINEIVDSWQVRKR